MRIKIFDRESLHVSKMCIRDSKYILESEKLLDEVKTENERAIVLINISNADCEKHEYKTCLLYTSTPPNPTNI